jgi:hypothetical protein
MTTRLKQALIVGASAAIMTLGIAGPASAAPADVLQCQPTGLGPGTIIVLPNGHVNISCNPQHPIAGTRAQVSPCGDHVIVVRPTFGFTGVC